MPGGHKAPHDAPGALEDLDGGGETIVAGGAGLVVLGDHDWGVLLGHRVWPTGAGAFFALTGLVDSAHGASMPTMGTRAG